MDTFDRVKSVLVDVLGVNPQSVTEDAGLINDLGSDSLDVVEITMGLEEEFDIEITDDDWASVITVADAVKLVSKRAAE